MKRTILAALGALALVSPARADIEGAGGFLATMTYVREHCPQYEVSVPKTVEILHALGQNTGSWKRQPPADVLRVAGKVTSQLESDEPDNVCPRIWNEFGTGGETFPDTLTRK